MYPIYDIYTTSGTLNRLNFLLGNKNRFLQLFHFVMHIKFRCHSYIFVSHDFLNAVNIYATAAKGSTISVSQLMRQQLWKITRKSSHVAADFPAKAIRILAHAFFVREDVGANFGLLG